MQTVDVLGGVLEGGPAVPLAIERVLAMLASQRPRADILEPFVEAARDVLATELGSEVTPGKLSVATGSLTTLDITVVVGMTGHVTGIAIYGLSDNLAHGILGQMRGSPIEELDDMAL